MTFAWSRPKFADDSKRLHAECLVQLKKVNGFDRPAGLGDHFPNGIDGCERKPLRLTAGSSLRTDDDHWFGAQFPRPVCARHHECRGAVAHAGSIAGGHSAAFFEGGFQPGEDLDGGLGTDGFVGIERARRLAFFRRGHFDGQDLRAEAAFGGRSGGAAMRLGGKGILIFAADVIFLRHHLGSGAHVEFVIDVPQPVVDHGVDQVSVAHAVAGTGLLKQVGRVGHRLHAAGNDDVGVAGLNRLVPPARLREDPSRRPGSRSEPLLAASIRQKLRPGVLDFDRGRPGERSP